MESSAIGGKNEEAETGPSGRIKTFRFQRSAFRVVGKEGFEKFEEFESL